MPWTWFRVVGLEVIWDSEFRPALRDLVLELRRAGLDKSHRMQFQESGRGVCKGSA